MSLGAPITVAPDRRCYVVYVGDDDEPVEMYGTPSEVKKEAQRRMDALKDNSTTSFRQKLRNNIPIRRKSSVATGTSTQEEEVPTSSINLLDLPTEILDAILTHVGVKNFYEEPSRLAVCKRWHGLVRARMARSVELDVNSLVRVLSLSRPSLVRKILMRRQRRSSATSTVSNRTGSSNDEAKIGLRLDAIHDFTADLRIINGFTVRNHVPIARNAHYTPWKTDVDRSFAWLAAHTGEMVSLKTFRLRAWTAMCVIASRHDRQWHRLARDTVAHLSLTTGLLDRVELDVCGTDFRWTRCGWGESDSSCCAAIARLVPRVRHLRLRLQAMCPAALTLPSSSSEGEGGGGTGSIRLAELIVNRDTTEANPWSQSGPHAGTCNRPNNGEGGHLAAAAGGGNREIVQAMRRLLPHMRPSPRNEKVRLLWRDDAFETRYDPSVVLPRNAKGAVAYRGSMAYDLRSHKVQRLGFLAAWDSEGVAIRGCQGRRLWEDEGAESTADETAA